MSGQRFKVSVFPVYDGDGDRTGDLCAYFEHATLEVAMSTAGHHAELWLDAPAETPDLEEERPIRFSVEVEVPG